MKMNNLGNFSVMFSTAPHQTYLIMYIIVVENYISFCELLKETPKQKPATCHFFYRKSVLLLKSMHNISNISKKMKSDT